jgi:hypothetical protein
MMASPRIMAKNLDLRRWAVNDKAKTGFGRHTFSSPPADRDQLSKCVMDLQCMTGAGPSSIDGVW